MTTTVHRAYDLRTQPNGQIRGICVSRFTADIDAPAFSTAPVSFPDYDALKQLLSAQMLRNQIRLEVRLNGNLV
jgi:hypothetical protein